MDNDGDQDLVLLDGGYEGPHPLKLYENVGEGEGDSGGYFRDVTKKAGLVGDRFRQFCTFLAASRWLLRRVDLALLVGDTTSVTLRRVGWIRCRL